MKYLKQFISVLTISILSALSLQSFAADNLGLISIQPPDGDKCYIICTFETVVPGVGTYVYQCFIGMCTVIDFVPVKGLNHEESSE